MRRHSEPLLPGAGRSGLSLAGLRAGARAQLPKAAITGVLVCVLLVLVIRGVCSPKSVSAGASTLPPPGPAAARPDVPAGVMEKVWALAAGVAPATRRGIAPDLARDIFAVNLRGFAKAGEKRAEEAAAMRAEPNPAEVETEKRKRALAGIHLEGTITGSSSAAFLDGTLVHPGELYRGWRVKEILDQRVVLECDGVRQELRMPE